MSSQSNICRSTIAASERNLIFYTVFQDVFYIKNFTEKTNEGASHEVSINQTGK